MEFVFWQNIIGIHQRALLTELSRLHRVTLVVEQETYQFRQKQGWKVPDLGKVVVKVAPTAEELHELLLQSGDAIHIFSGFQTYRLTHRAFRFAIDKSYKTLVYTEPYDLKGFRGLVRYLRLLISRLRYGHKVDGILVTGNGGRACFSKAGFDSQKIYDFAYFTDTGGDTAINNSEPDSFNKPDSPKPDLLFVGRIDERKNILNLVKVCKKLQDRFHTFEIYGAGHLEPALKSELEGTGNISFRGSIDYDRIQELMYQKDILILPSLFDGWGAVVNEALEHGMRVLASENCGASVLLDGEQRGAVFSSDINHMQQVLETWIDKGKHSSNERQEIIRWCSGNISGRAAAEYFSNICNHIYRSETVRPTAPWLRKQAAAWVV